MPEWDEQGNPIQSGGQEWDEQGNPIGASAPKPPKSGGVNPLFSPLRGASIAPEKPLWQRALGQVKGFAQELPLIGVRGFNLLEDIATGNAAMNAAGNQTPEEQAKQILASEERYKRRQAINDLLGGAKDGEAEQRVGRIGARMVPGFAAAAATGGASLPAQMMIQGTVQGAQTLSEGASPTEAATGAGIASLGPLLGGGANALGTKVKNPFTGKVNQQAVQAAQRLGVELPAGAMTDSSVARGLEQMGSRMLGGGGIEARGLKAGQDIAEAAGGLSAGADSTAAGQAVAEDYAARRGALQATKNAEYAKVGDLTKIGANPEETLAAIDKMLAEGTASPDVLESLRKLRAAIAPKDVFDPETEALLKAAEGDPKMQELIRLRGGAPTSQPRSVADLMSQQAGIEYGGPNAMRDAGLGNKLREALRRDYTGALESASPEQAAQLDAAKKAYGQYADLTDSTLGKTVTANAKTVDRIPDNLLRSTASRADLQRLMDVSAPETRTELQRVLLRQIVGDGQSLTPKAIETALKKYRNLDVILDPEQIQRLKDLSTVRQALARTTVGSPTTPLLQARKYIETPARAALAGSLAGLAGIGVDLASEAGISRFLGSELGQRWLTTGLGKATLPGKLVQAPLTAAARMPAELSLDQRRRRAELDALLGQ